MTTPIIYTGQNIRFKRTDAGLSQSELAKLCGLTQNRISAIEGGSNFTQKTLIRILEAINNHVKQTRQNENNGKS